MMRVMGCTTWGSLDLDTGEFYHLHPKNLISLVLKVLLLKVKLYNLLTIYTINDRIN